MAAAPLIVDLERLDRDGEQFAGEIPASVLELKGMDAELFKPAGDIHYDLFVELLDDELLVNGSAWQRFKSTCVRCACQFEWECRDSHIMFAVQPEESIFLDLTNDVREAILMGFPNHPNCSEECRGLCPTCGVDLNVETCSCKSNPTDIRWGALDQLLTPPEE